MKADKITEAAAASALASAFKVQRSTILTEVLSQARWCLGHAPVECRVVLDKVPIIPAFCLAARTPQRNIAFLAEEIEMGTPMIIFDSNLSGADAAFVLREFCDASDMVSTVSRILAHQREPLVMMAGFRDRFFYAVKLLSLIE
jgi:hypothetical protein